MVQSKVSYTRLPSIRRATEYRHTTVTLYLVVAFRTYSGTLPISPHTWAVLAAGFFTVEHVKLELAQDLTEKQPLAYRSRYSLFRNGRKVTTYRHAALVLEQVAPVADEAPLLNVALVLRALVHPAEAGNARNPISRRNRPILVEDLIRDADVAMAPCALWVRIRKPDALAKAPVCRVR